MPAQGLSLGSNLHCNHCADGINILMFISKNGLSPHDHCSQEKCFSWSNGSFLSFFYCWDKWGSDFSKKKVVEKKGYLLCIVLKIGQPQEQKINSCTLINIQIDSQWINLCYLYILVPHRLPVVYMNTHTVFPWK